MSNVSSEWASFGWHLSPLCCQVLWDSTRCGEPAIAAPFYSTLPTAAPLWDPCLIPHLMLVPHLISAVVQKQPRSVSQTDATSDLQIVQIFFLWLFALCRDESLAFRFIKFSEHHYLLESLCLIDSQGITHRQTSTVIANWPLIHVLNTMFCEEGRNCITAITFSSGSQCAYRFCVFFTSFG